MRGLLTSVPFVALLAACHMDPTGGGEGRDAGNQKSASASAQPDDGFLSRDATEASSRDPALVQDKERPVMQMQVVLDRLGFTPGVVDGKVGLSTRNALAGFQEARELKVTGEADEATSAALKEWSAIPATRLVTIPAEFAAGPFVKTPDGAAEQAKLEKLGYESLEEKLAERFHTTSETLRSLNPDLEPPAATQSPIASPTPESREGSAARPSASPFRAGLTIRVPNVGADRIEASKVKDAGWLATLRSLGIGTQQPQAARIVVSKSKGMLKAYDAADTLVAVYTATMGSSRDPLPLGEWKITGVSHNPDFAYNPELFWDVPDSTEKQRLPPGPNGPVGVAWIDLSKEHYGIHGTPEPDTIGRAQSHGCVRLTNWDVARLTQMVSTKTRVLFEA
jgi:lipoprotein-anchoring transpeptidase ErfK/SrfK